MRKKLLIAIVVVLLFYLCNVFYLTDDGLKDPFDSIEYPYKAENQTNNENHNSNPLEESESLESSSSESSSSSKESENDSSESLDSSSSNKESENDSSESLDSSSSNKESENDSSESLDSESSSDESSEYSSSDNKEPESSTNKGSNWEESPESKEDIKISDSHYESFFKIPEKDAEIGFDNYFEKLEARNKSDYSNYHSYFKENFEIKDDENKIVNFKCNETMYYKRNYSDLGPQNSLIKNSSNISIEVNQNEFIIFGCNNSNYSYIEYKELMKNKIVSSNDKNDTRNNIVIIDISSISVAESHRSLKNLTNLLKNSSELNGQWIEYNYNQVYSDNPAENTALLLYGMSLKFLKFMKKKIGNHISNNTFMNDLIKRSLVKQYESNNYKTLVLNQNHPEELAVIDGKKLNENFKYSSFSNFIDEPNELVSRNKEILKEKVLEIEFDYIRYFWQEEQNENKFIYTHFDILDNESNHVDKFDELLVSFLKEIDEVSLSKGQKLAVFLLSDHGLNIKSIENTVQGYLEKYSPMMKIYLNQDMSKGFNLSTVLANSDKAINRFDLYHTLKSIPSGSKNDSYEILKVHDILSENIINRKCSSAVSNHCPIFRFVESDSSFIDIKFREYIEKKECKNLAISKFYEIKGSFTENQTVFYEMFLKDEKEKITGRCFAYSNSSSILIDSIYYLNDNKIIRCK